MYKVPRNAKLIASLIKGKSVKSKFLRIFYKLRIPELIVVENRDGSQDCMVSIGSQSYGRDICFKYPYESKDYSREVRSEYIRFRSKFGNFYVFLARPFASKFPNYICY